MNFRQKISVVVIDALVLAELTLALYCSARGGPDDAPALFLKIFLPSMIATLILGRIIMKRLGKPAGPDLPDEKMRSEAGVS